MNWTRRRWLHHFAGSAVAAGLPRLASAGEAGPGVVFLDASHAEFERRRTVFNKRIALKPKIIAACSTETGVVEAVRFARKEGLPIAVKSGGHSFEGFSMNGGGLVVDLSDMNGLTLNAGNVLRAGPGCRLGDVYSYLIPRGRLLPAGTCGGVGLAGLTLGGGYGFFSRAFGLTCDNLTRVRMVDGAGEVHDSQTDPDLLWASRGGGTAGLGVVTALEYTTHAAPKTLHSFRYRYRMKTAEEFVALAQQWAKLTRELPTESYSAFVANGRTVTILVASFLPQPRDKRIAKTLEALGIEASRVEEPRSDPLLAGIRRYTGQKGPLYFKNASGGFYRTIDEMGAAAAAIFEAVLKQAGTIFQINTFGPFPKAPATAFPHRDFPLIGELQAYWEQPSAEARVLKTIASLQAALTASGVRAHYANYVDVNLTDWARAYYGEANYARLQVIKKRYDPDNLFRHPQSIPL